MSTAIFTDKCAELSSPGRPCSACGRTGTEVTIIDGGTRTGYLVEFEDGLRVWADANELQDAIKEANP